MKSSFAAKRKVRRVGLEDDETERATTTSNEETTPVVIRPAVSSRSSSKPKNRSSLRMSFGPEQALGADDSNDTTGVFTPKKSNLSRQAIEKNAIRKSLATPISTEHIPIRQTDDRPSYSKDYLTELKSSTPSTPKDLTSLSDVEDDKGQALDIASKFGSDLAVLQQDSAIPTEAEIREKKERRHRLAKEKNFISLSDADDSNQISLLPKKKKSESRLVRDDEDIAEGFDEFVEDGRISLGKKAEREQRRRHKAEMRDMIHEAEGGSSESDSDDSENERNAEYEATQTRKGMDGLRKEYELQGHSRRPRTPPRITPLPNLTSCLERLQARLAAAEYSRAQKIRQMEILEKEKKDIVDREGEIQGLLKEAGDRYEKLRIDAGMSTNGVNLTPTTLGPITVTTTFTGVISTSTTATLEIPLIFNGSNQFTTITLSQPTTFVTVLTAYNYESPVTEPPAVETPGSNEVYTATITVPGSGREIFNAPSGAGMINVTVSGPTTYTGTFTFNELGGGDGELHPVADPSDTHCSGTGIATNPAHLLSFAQFLTFIPAGQIATVTYTAGELAGDVGEQITAGLSVKTTVLTGPASFSETLTTSLVVPFNEDPEGGAENQLCGGRCGFCQLYFPTVEVYYWPVAHPNTACLGNSNATTPTTVAPVSKHGMVARPHAIRGLTGDGSILVSNGFTFTSPSAYVAFDQISATDECGIIGPVLTGVTIPFPSGELSTAVYYSTSDVIYFPFNYADALCEPASLSTINHISFISSGDYKPIISPPSSSILALYGTWANYACGIPPFQGNDPPFALQPAVNIDPGTTVHGPAPAPASASADPSPGVPALPQQTTSPMFNPAPQTTSEPTVKDPPSNNDPGNGSPAPPQNQNPAPVPVPADPNPVNDAPDPLQNNNPAPLPTNNIPGNQAPAPPQNQSPAPAAAPGAAVISTTPIPSVVVINGVTSRIQVPSPGAAAPALPVLSLGNQIMTADLSSHFVLPGGQTLVPGAPPIIVAGTTVSIDPGAGHAVIGGSTQDLVPAKSGDGVKGVKMGGEGAPAAGPVATIANQPVSLDPEGSIIYGSGQTLTPGAPPVMISGTLVSLGPGASFLVAGSSTVVLSAQTPGLVGPGPGLGQINVGGQILTANSAGEFVAGSQTLLPGGPAITFSGSTFSLPAVVFVPTSGAASAPVTEAELTFNGQTFTADQASNFVLNGQTLTPGGAITVSGTPISLPAGPHLTDVVIGTSTQGLASFIASGIGGNPGTTGQGDPFEGGSARSKGTWWIMARGISVSILALFCGLYV